MPGLTEQIAESVARVRERIERASASAGRDPSSVRLVAITKYHGPAVARALVAAGCHDLGESRPQELWAKAAALADLPVRWHLVGHLQRNKIRRTLPLASLIHSVDSHRLLESLEAEAALAGRTADVLLEVQLAGGEERHGFSPDETPAIAAALAEFPQVRVQGLMGMAPAEGGEASAAACFRRLRELRDRLARDFPALPLRELSMGMSGDFEVAIREGATLVRLGSVLFEGLDAVPVHEALRGRAAESG